MTEQNDYSLLLHGPDDLAGMHVEYYKYLQKHPGITWGIPGIDKRVIPLRPGQLCIIAGRPGAGKTSIMARQAKHTALEIASRDAQMQECVVYVTWEQIAEELEAFFESNKEYNATDYAWVRVPLEKIYKNVVKRAGLPLWMVGHSWKHRDKKLPIMTPSVVFKAIESMAYGRDECPRPVLMCFDYAQLIPPDQRARARHEQIRNAIIGVKHLALRIGCPAIVAVQASRDVDDRDNKIPQMRDAQGSSGLEQTTDKFFGVWRPWVTEPPGSTIELPGGKQLEVTPDLCMLAMRKQRNDNGSFIWPMSFNTAELTLAELELEEKPLRY